MSKIRTEETEIHDQAAPYWAEGTSEDQPTKAEIMEYLFSRKALIKSDIEIWYDNFQKIWRWMATITFLQ